MRRPIRIPTATIPRAERPFSRGLVGSVAVHGLVILGIIWGANRAAEEFLAIGGSWPAGGGGGGGGSEVTYVALPPLVNAEAQAAVQPAVAPRVVTAIPTPQLKPIAREQPDVRLFRAAVPVEAPAQGRGAEVSGGPGTGIGSGGGIGAGKGTGIGSGQGPGTGGEGGDGFPARSRELLMPPPDPPVTVKGREFRVRFLIDARGRVRKVEVEPRMEDSGYRSKFFDKMRRYRFYPARSSDGKPVPGRFDIWITP